MDSIKSNYFIVRNHLLDHAPSRALLLLGDLLTKENYAHVESHMTDHELYDDNYTSLSHVMQIATDQESLGEGFIFLLTDNFFLSKAAAAIKVLDDVEDIGTMCPYLVSLFRFPDLNQYKKEELQSLRQSLNVQSIPFAESVKSWIASFANAVTDESEQKKKINQLYTHALELGQALKEHVLVQKIGTKEREVELVLGEVPAKVIWEYFREVGAVPDDTWEVLINTPEGEKLCPVMALRYPDRAHFYVAEENEETPIQTQKKSLLID